MRKINLILSLSLLLSYAKAENCWATVLGYDCCKQETTVFFTDEDGDWSIENDLWCGIIKKQTFEVVEQKISDDPKLEISKIKVPSNYCWTEISKATRCCTSAEIQNGEVDLYQDGEAIFYEDGRTPICGVRGYNAHWNDREKFVYTKKEWEAFKTVWDKKYKDDFQRLSVFVGEDETYLNFGWYSITNSEAAIRFGKDKNLEYSQVYYGTTEFYRTIRNVKYYSNKVTVSNLKPNSVYYYKRKLNGVWENDIIEFKTYDENNFKFILIGDPQIGGSKERISVADFTRILGSDEATRNDAFNWNMTVYNSFKVAGKPSLMLSVGDQIETECFEMTDDELYSQETQYSAFLLPKLMQTIPTATAVGNHEAVTDAYKHHFNTPNSYLTPVEKFRTSGYNYFFKYNNVLVVVLETNYGVCDDFREVLRQAHAKHPNTDWRIAMFHHNIYGNGVFHSQDDLNLDLRKCLTELMSYYKFDVALNGHDHIYTASHYVSYSNNKKGYTIDTIKPNNVYRNPKGTFYITANCSTGSKLYGSRKENYDYVSNYIQDFLSSFGILDFTKKDGILRLTISNYDVDTQNKVDGNYIIEKPEKCWATSQGYPCCTENKDIYFIDDYLWGIENDEWCGIIEEDLPINKTPIVSKLKPIAKKDCWAYDLGYLCCADPPAIYDKQYGVDKYGRYCGLVDKSVVP